MQKICYIVLMATLTPSLALAYNLLAVGSAPGSASFFGEDGVPGLLCEAASLLISKYSVILAMLAVIAMGFMAFMGKLHWSVVITVIAGFLFIGTISRIIMFEVDNNPSHHVLTDKCDRIIGR